MVESNWCVKKNRIVLRFNILIIHWRSIRILKTHAQTLKCIPFRVALAMTLNLAALYCRVCTCFFLLYMCTIIVCQVCCSHPFCSVHLLFSAWLWPRKLKYKTLSEKNIQKIFSILKYLGMMHGFNSHSELMNPWNMGRILPAFWRGDRRSSTVRYFDARITYILDSAGDIRACRMCVYLHAVDRSKRQNVGFQYIQSLI